MKHNLKRFACLMLSMLMVFSFLPMSAFAAGDGTDVGTGGGQTGKGDLYVKTHNQCFLHVTLVELPSASATAVNDIKVVSEMILYNGMPSSTYGSADESTLKMLGNNAIDYLQGTDNKAPMSFTELRNQMPVLDYTTCTEYQTWSKNELNGGLGLEFWNGGGAKEATGWTNIQTAFGAFYTKINDVWAPNAFLNKVLGILFTQSGFTEADAEAAWDNLPEQTKNDRWGGAKLPWVALFMTAVDPEIGSKLTVGSVLSGNPTDEEKADAGKKAMKYRLLVEPGLFVKELSTGKWMGYTVREAGAINAGKISGFAFKDNIVQACIDANTTLSKVFHTVKDEWYDLIMTDTNTDNPMIRFSGGNVAFKNSNSGYYSKLTEMYNLTADGYGYGLGIMTPYTFGSPPEPNHGGSTTFSIVKDVEGVGKRGIDEGVNDMYEYASNVYYSVYGVVDARSFVSKVLDVLPEGVSLTDIDISFGTGTTDDVGYGKLVTYYNNYASKINSNLGTYAETSNILKDSSLGADKLAKLPDQIYTDMFFMGVLRTGGQIDITVNWSYDLGKSGKTSDEIDALINPLVPEIALYVEECSVWDGSKLTEKIGAGVNIWADWTWLDCMTADGLLYLATIFGIQPSANIWSEPDKYKEEMIAAAPDLEYSLYNLLPLYQISMNTTFSCEPADSLVGVYARQNYADPNELLSAYNGTLDGCFTKSIADFADETFSTPVDTATEALFYNAIMDSSGDYGKPAVVVKSSGADTNVAITIYNNTGLRFHKMTDGDDTEYSFKVTSVSLNGETVLPDDYTILYAKDPETQKMPDWQEITISELKEQVFTASNGHGYVFVVPYGFVMNVQEIDDDGNPITSDVSAYSIKGTESDQTTWEPLTIADAKTTISKTYPDVVFFNGDLKLGGPCHVIIDYNLNGIAATTFNGNETCMVIAAEHNPVECGTMMAGESAHAELNGEIEPTMVIYTDPDTGGEIKATFKGIFTEPTGGTQLAGPEAIEEGFDFTVPVTTPEDHLIVLYAQWEFECPSGGGSLTLDGELYPIIFDHNYTGGPTIDITVGEITLSGSGSGSGSDDDEPFVPCECGCDTCTGDETCTCCESGTKCCDACTCELPAVDEGDDAGDGSDSSEGEGDDSGSGGSVSGSVKLGFYDPYAHIKDDLDERNSMRTGWLFCGWSHDADTVVPVCGLPSDQNESTDTSYRGFDEDFMPEEAATYYGIWFANDITWDANGGTIDGAATYTQPGRIYMAAERVPADVSVPVREGYHFNGWYWDQECMNPIQEFESGVQPGQTYYAGWVADPVYVYYYDTRENTTLIGKQEYEYGDTFTLLSPFNGTDGQRFQDWVIQGGNTSATSISVLTSATPGMEYHERAAGEDGNPVWGNGYWELNIEASWAKTTASFNAIIDWSDYSNNDGARPVAVEVGLLSSLNNKTEQTYVMTAANAVDASGNIWQHKFEGLDITTSESSVEEITYSIYIKSYTDIDGHYYEIGDTAATSGLLTMAAVSNADTAVWAEYRYGINNYMTDDHSYDDGFVDNEGSQLQLNNRLYAGKISFSHDLITTGNDIQFTIEWDDDSDNDGIRPGAVQLTLYANGKPVKEYPLHNSYTGFVSVSQGMCDVSRDGDVWTYTFKDYQKYDQGKPIEYTVSIKPVAGYETLYLGGNVPADPNGVRMYHSLETTKKTVVIHWDDELNRDGQRPPYVEVELVAYQYNRADAKWETVHLDHRTLRAEDYVLGETAAEWSTIFDGLLKYNDGKEIIYQANVTSNLNAHLEEGFNEYSWVSNDLDITISQKRSVKDLPIVIEWNDANNNDTLRPRSVRVQLYADGDMMEGDRWTHILTGDMTANTWEYTFSNLPVYREGKSGEEIVYTFKVEEVQADTLYGSFISMENGYEEEIIRYTASYQTIDGATTEDFSQSGRAYVRLTHDVQQGSVYLAVNWHDDSNKDGKRPTSVLVDLYKQVDGVRTFVETVTITAGSAGRWDRLMSELPLWENGKQVMYIAEVSDDFRNQLKDQYNYTCSMEGLIVHMYYTPEVGSVSTRIHWVDDDNNDNMRPDCVKVVLKSNGLLVDGSEIELNELNDWSYTWQDLPSYYLDKSGVSQKVVYTVDFVTPDGYEREDVPASTTTVDDREIVINLSHDNIGTEVPFTIYWNDNANQDGRRPESVKIQLYANGEVKVGYEMTVTGDPNASIWTGVFTGDPADLPAYENGKLVNYTVVVNTDVRPYEQMIAGTNVYFSCDVLYDTLRVSINFSDNNNADGLRPEGLYLTLTANGEVVTGWSAADHVRTVYFDADGLVNIEFDGLPVCSADGNKIAYSVQIEHDANVFDGDGSAYNEMYVSKDIQLSGNPNATNSNQLVIRLVKDQEMGTQAGHIYWYDVNDMRGNRPTSVTVEISDNIHSNTNIYVLKLDGKGADSGVVLDSKNNVVGNVTVSEWADDRSVWTYVILDLPSNAIYDGRSQPITYLANVRTTGMLQYTKENESGMDTDLVHRQYYDDVGDGYQDFHFVINWLDNSNVWNYRPDTTGLTAILKANEEPYKTVQMTGANAVAGNPNAWEYNFSNLPTFIGGVPVRWTVELVQGDGYTSYVIESPVTPQDKEEQVVTMRQTIGFDFTINWDDDDNNDRERPATLVLSIKADGTEKQTIRYTPVLPDGVEYDETPAWKFSVAGLPVWRDNPGDKPIEYTFTWTDETGKVLQEANYSPVPVGDGWYELSVNAWGDCNDPGWDELTGQYQWSTTLKHDNEKTTVIGEITFDDNNNQDGKRPDSLLVQLYANGKPSGDPVTVTPDELGNWSLIWPDMDRLYKGEPIEYTVKLVQFPPDYDITEDGMSILLYHKPETISVSVTMKWDDDSEIHRVYNRDGIELYKYGQIPRIDMDMRLLADGAFIYPGDTGTPIVTSTTGSAIIRTENGYVEIAKSGYGTGTNLNKTYVVTWPEMPKYCEGELITYTFDVDQADSTELDNMLANGRYVLTLDQESMTALITRKLFDVTGSVYYLSKSDDDFRLPNVPVSIYGQDETTGNYVCLGTTFTDDNGDYTLTNVPNGLLLVRATYTYAGLTQVGIEGIRIDREDGSADIIVDRDASADDGRYTYTGSGNAYYQTDITDESTKHPVSEGSIALLYRVEDGVATYVGMTVTDANGHYEFDGLTTGAYLVNIVFNYNGGVYTYDNSDAVADGLSFNIASGSTIWNDIVKQVNADISMDDPNKPSDPEPVEPEPGPQACVLKGYVYFSDNGIHTTEPVDGVDVYIYTANTQLEAGKTMTDEDGFWTVDGIPVGSYVAVFSYQGSTSRVLTFDVTDADYEAGEKTLANQYFDRETKEPIGTIKGVVLNEDGKRESALVQILDQNNQVIAFTYTDPNGLYNFTVPAGKTYRVQILQVGINTENLKAGDPDDELTTLDYYILSGNFTKDGVAVEGARVVAAMRDDSIREEDKWVVKNASMTDNNGNWSIRVAETGNYRITTYLYDKVYKEQYITVGYQEWTPQVSANADGTYRVTGREEFDSVRLYDHTNNIVTVQDGGWGNSYDFNYLTPGVYEIRVVKGTQEKWYYFDVPNGGPENGSIQVDYYVTISGKALDIHGNPALGAVVRILDKDGNQIVDDYTVLANGSYGWHNIKGSYDLLTSVGDYTVQIDYPTVGDTLADKTTEEPDSYNVKYPGGMPDGSVWCWNINAHVVSGTVTDQNGTPIPGATVLIRDKNNPEIVIGTVTTDGNGNFVIGVPDGEYEIQSVFAYDPDHTYPSDKQDLIVNGGDVGGISLTINRYRVTVEVYRDTDNMPMVGADVEIRQGDRVVATGTTDENGYCLIDGILPDTYEIYVKHGVTEGSKTVLVVNNTRVTIKMAIATVLSGIVYDPDGVTPAADAIVHFNGQYTNQLSGTVFTDDNGYYEVVFQSKALGLYEVWAEGGGYKSSLETVNVRTDVTHDIQLGNSVSPNPVHQLSGVVVDNEGHRLENAVVTLTYGNDKTNILTTSTNGNGEYRFMIPDGTYYLTAAYTSDTGYTYYTNGERTVHMDGADLPDQQLVITLAYKVTVKVTDDLGDIIRDAMVSWFGASFGSAVVGNTGMIELMLAGGNYSSIVVTSGNRTGEKTDVMVNGATYLEFVLGQPKLDDEPPVSEPTDLTIDGYVYDDKGIPVEGAKVVLKKMDEWTLEWLPVDSTTSGVDGFYEFRGLDDGRYMVEIVYDKVLDSTTETKYTTIEGHALDANGNPYVGATVNLYTADGRLYVTTYSDEDGYYKFSDLPAGTYRIEVLPKNDEGNGQNSWVTANPEDSTIEGIVLDAAGRPVEGALVEVWFGDDVIASMKTDETGAYAFDLPDDGTYKVVITVPASYNKNTETDPKDEPNPDDPNDPIIHDDNYTISGYVKDTDGNIVTEGVMVYLRDANGETLAFKPVDENGYYEFTGLRPGNYQVDVVWDKANSEQNYPMHVPPRDVEDDPNPVDPVPGMIHVSGIVTASHGKPLPGAIVTVRNADTGEEFQITADADGRFDTGDMPDGRYELVAAYTHKYGTNTSDMLYVVKSQDNVALTIVLSYKADVNGDGRDEQVFAGEDDMFDTPDDFYEADIEPDGIKEPVYAGVDGKPGTEDDWYPYDVDKDGEMEKVYVGPDRIPGTSDDWYEYDVDKDGKPEHILAGPNGIPGDFDDRYEYDINGDGKPETVFVGKDGKPGTDDDWYYFDVDGTNRVIHVGDDGIPGTADDWYEYDVNGDGEMEHIYAGPDGIPGTDDDWYGWDIDGDGVDEKVNVGEDGKPGTPDDTYYFDVDNDGADDLIHVGNDGIPGTPDDWWLKDIDPTDGNDEPDTIYAGDDGIPGTEDDWYWSDPDDDGEDEQVFVGPDTKPGTDDDWYIDDDGNKTFVGAWIYYDAMGGTVMDSDHYVIRLKDFEKSPTATRDGYQLSGWYTSATGGTKMTDAKISKLTESIVLYAHWTKKSSVPSTPPSVPSNPGLPNWPGIDWPPNVPSDPDIDINDPDTPLGDMVSVAFDTDGGDYIEDQILEAGQKAERPADPVKEGYIFVGWQLDGEDFDFDTPVMDDITLIAVWQLDGLLRLDHIAYIQGNNLGYVCPNQNMTRAEVAAMFYRLLNDEVRDEYRTTVNAFIDVAPGAWYETEVSTLAKLGILQGVGGGLFAPNRSITRAEFAAVASRFDKLESTDSNPFSDVSESHWAYKYIQSAAAKGWIVGRGDGKFYPDEYITRAEVITLVNRVLGRDKLSVDGMLDDMITWPDNSDPSAWYYLDMQEATNGHNGSMHDDEEHWDELVYTDFSLF